LISHKNSAISAVVSLQIRFKGDLLSASRYVDRGSDYNVTSYRCPLFFFFFIYADSSRRTTFLATEKLRRSDRARWIAAFPDITGALSGAGDSEIARKSPGLTNALSKVSKAVTSTR